MEIYITDLTTNESVQIPMMPEKISVAYENNFLSYDVLRVGEVKFPSGVKLTGIKWDGTFPGEARKNQPYVTNWVDPKEFHNWLDKIKLNGTKVRVLITETPINFDNYLASYAADFEGGYGDIKYSISFIQAKDINITDETEVVTPAAEPPEEERPTPPPPPPEQKRTYTVVSGDCLWDIAAAQLGNPNRWPEIYELNKGVIGGNPNLIYPGQVYTLP